MARGWRTLRRLSWRPRAGAKARPLCSASGLVRAPGRLWIAGDDLNHLVELKDGAAVGRGHRLFKGTLPNDAKRRKKRKRDVEALVDLGDGVLLALPSGSRKRRRMGALFDTRTGRARRVDLGRLVSALEKRLGPVNLEGGFVADGRLVLLQRGNGRRRFSALVELEGGRISWRKVPLGSWKGVRLAFTDGFWHDGAAYFSAAAEASEDSYLDGAVVGSVIGTLTASGQPRILARLPGLKVEGLALDVERRGRLRLLAVTDADDPGEPSRLLAGWVTKRGRSLTALT